MADPPRACACDRPRPGASDARVPACDPFSRRGCGPQARRDATCAADLRGTAEELFVHARPWAHLDIDIVHDAEDIYLRMAVEQQDPRRHPRVTVHRLVFAGPVDSVDVRTEDARVYGVAQRALHRCDR